MTTDLECKEGNTYSILANTSAGAAHMRVICDGKVNNNYRYTFTNWKDVEALVFESNVIGVAFPVQGDRFNVYRFSLRGANRANEFLEKAFFDAKIDPKSTDTITL